MNDVVTLVDAVEKVGIPILFFLIALYLVFKCYPNYMEVRKKERDHELSTQDEMRKMYNKQYETMAHVAEQSNQMIGQATQVIAQATEVIRMNTEIIKANTDAHKAVKEALSRDLAALHTLDEDLKSHDKRAEETNTNVKLLLDRVE